jgi:hypothetical protein
MTSLMLSQPSLLYHLEDLHRLSMLSSAHHGTNEAELAGEVRRNSRNPLYSMSCVSTNFQAGDEKVNWKKEGF